MKIKTLAALAVLVTTSLFAGSEGGGGDAVILPDGEVVLADVFLDRNQAQPDNMPRRISLNPLLLLQVQKYSLLLNQQVDRSTLFSDESEVVKLYQEVGLRNSNLVFYSVKDENELNTYCASGGRKAYLLPSGANVTQVACTSGKEIFLVESTFKKMDLLNQSLLLLHERLTTLRDQYGGKNYGAISGVTNGLGTIVKIAYKQQNGDRTSLSDTDLAKLSNFYKALIEIEYRNKDVSADLLDWKIQKNGGGLIHKHAEVSEGAFVGVTTVVGSNVVVQNGATLLDAKIYPMGQKAQVEIESGVEVINSSIFGRSVILAEKSKIKNSYLNVASFNSGREFQMTGARINLEKINQKIVLKDGQKLRKEEYIIDDSFNYFPSGHKFNEYSFALNFKTDCQDKINVYVKSEKDYPCALSQTVSEKYRDEEFFHDIVSNVEEGFEITMNKILDIKLTKISSKNVYQRTEAVREVNLKAVLKNTDDIDNQHGKVISHGEIKPVGQSKLRKLLVPKYWRPLLIKRISEQAKNQGISAEGNDYVVFRLPNE